MTQRHTWATTCAGDDAAAKVTESGHITLLGLGYGVVVAAFIMVIAAVSAVYLDVKHATAVADRAVAYAARELGATHNSAQPGADEWQIRRLIEERISQEGDTGSLTQVEIVEARRDAQQPEVIVVTLHAYSQPGFLPWGIIPTQGVDLKVSSSARQTARLAE